VEDPIHGPKRALLKDEDSWLLLKSPGENYYVCKCWMSN
jgi:hypothetical protein